MMLLFAMAAAAVGACLPVTGPVITGSDIAGVVAGYVPSTSSAAVFGYSPTPGVRRVVHPSELQWFLRDQHFTGAMPVNDICFERPTMQLTDQAVKKAMQSTLGQDAHIELLELSHFPVPVGQIVFERNGLGTPPMALWHGNVEYDGGAKKFPIWARVKISVKLQRIVATEDLRPGKAIGPDQVNIITVEDFPGTHVTPSALSKVIGAMPKRFINANTPVWEDAIEPPNQVLKGDRVFVTVSSGMARLAFEAEAENSGRLGDVIAFKNPESGKVFRARVIGPDQASVQTTGLSR